MKKVVIALVLLVILLLAISQSFAHEGEEETAEKPTLIHWILDHYYWIAGVIIAIALIITILKSIKNLVKLAMSWGVVLVALYLVYSVLYTYALPKEERETVLTCLKDNCTLSLHVHANLDAKVCGEELRFPLEEGDLDEAHTHKEKARIHVHDSFAYDNTTQQILDTAKLTLGNFFDQTKIRFTEECIENYCNGDLCNGTPGTLRVWVNVTDISQQELDANRFRSYVWHDEETIKIRFE